MDAIFIDQFGHKKNFLYQYDKGQSFVVENFEYSTAPKVQFSIKSLKTSPSVNSKIKDGNLIAPVPDMLLTYGEDIIAYLYIDDSTFGKTIETVFISVSPRKYPVEYSYTSEMFTRNVNGTSMSEKFGVTDVAAWEDGNPKEQDRTGYFVCVNYQNDHLTAAISGSILTVNGVAVEPSGFATNCSDDKLDQYGNLDSKHVYVCSYGFAKVIDNGRCAGANRCAPSTNGTAVPSVVGYPIIGRIDSKTILIFVAPGMGLIESLNTNLNGTSANLASHKDNTNNPHNVTKSQVGLSEVPNVTTNNQAPTYTTATTLQALLSGEKLSNAFAKLSKAVTDLIAHIANKSNPHSVTKAQVGLGNCDNTSDVNKPVSTAQATEIARVEGLSNNAQNDINTHSAKTDNPHGVTKAQVGLGNCNNTSDANKPISTAQATEFTRIEGLVNTAQGDINTHAAKTNNPHSVTKAQIGLGNCNNTSDANKPISTATQAALDKKADLDANGHVPLAQLPSQVKEMRVVDTIAARDAITDKFENLRVYVKDASADPSVTSGGADYLYDGTSWIKTSESESLDLILSWDNITDKPSEFTPADHTHTKTEVGLGNIDNTSDVDKPISTAVQQALDDKASLVDGKIVAENIPDSFTVDSISVTNVIIMTDTVTGEQHQLKISDGQLVID